MADLTKDERGRGQRWSRASAAAAVLLATALLAFAMTGCGNRIETVTNTAIWFWGDVQGRKWGQAYDWLCTAEKERVGEDKFANSGGDRYSGLVSLQSDSSSWHQYREMDTLDSDITEAWTEIAGMRAGTTEVSRLDMVREHGRLEGVWDRGDTSGLRGRRSIAA